MGSISTTGFQEYSVWEKDVCSKDVLYHLNYTFSNLDRSKKWAIIIDVNFFSINFFSVRHGIPKQKF